jgi:hypothetical protein
MTQPNAGSIVFIALIIWGAYRRIKRSIGRQPLRPVRSIISLVVLTLVSGLVLKFASNNTNALLAFGGGALLGAGLGIVGLRLTKFETTSEGHFFIPNTKIGIALSALFIGRILYKNLPLLLNGNNNTTNSGVDAQGHPLIFQSPLTLLILGLTIGYYFIYRVGILIHMRDKIIGGGTPKPPVINPPPAP